MKKFLIFLTILIGALTIQHQVQAFQDESATNVYIINFQDVADYANFSRTWLSLCPKVIHGNYQGKSKPEKDIIAKICNTHYEEKVYDFVKYLVAINALGSFDIKYDQYNLPGAAYVKQWDTISKVHLSHIEPLSKDLTKLIPAISKPLPDELFFTNLRSTNAINQATESIRASCNSSDKNTYKLCNDLLNISDPSRNQNIFSPNNLNPIFLQQMHYNMLSNAQANSQIQALANQVYFASFNQTFRKEVLEPTLSFGDNFKFDFTEIQTDTSYADVKIHLAPGGLGLLLDTITNWASNSAEGIYNFLSSALLEVRFQTVTDSNLKEVWATFRNITNIGFVVLFLVIIVSQLTGFAISNYSIKKLLPKLIVGVILVNLSFYIAQIMVDLSNIVGHYLFKLLVNDGHTVSGFATQYNNLTLVKGTVATILSLLLLIITSVLSIISAVVAIVATAIRDAIIIVLVVISPLALLCGIVPAFNRFHSTWWRVLINMLTIFPMASMLIGTAFLVDKIIYTSDSGIVSFIIAKLAVSGTLITLPFLIIQAVRQIDSTIKVGGRGILSAIPATAFLLPTSPVGVATGSINRFNKTRLGKLRQEAKEKAKLNKRANRQGAFWAQSAMQARGQLEKQWTDDSLGISQDQAAELIYHLHNNSIDRISSPELRQSYEAQLRASGNSKEAALALAVAHARDNSGQKNPSAHIILMALNHAKKQGASQAELQSATGIVMNELDKKADFRSIGIMKANLEYHQGIHGNYNAGLLAEADSSTPASSKGKAYHNILTRTTQEAYRKYGITASAKQAGIMENLNAYEVRKGSVANKIMLNDLVTNSFSRDAFLNNYHKLSKETQEIFQADSDKIFELRDRQNALSDHLKKLPHESQTLYAQKQQQINMLNEQLANEMRQYIQEFTDQFQAQFPNQTLDSNQATNYANHKTQSLRATISSQEHIFEGLKNTAGNVATYEAHRQVEQEYFAIEDLKNKIINEIKANNPD